MGIFNLSEDTVSKPDDQQQPESKILTDNTVLTDSGSNTDKSKEEKTIVIDGPLSNIYTQALNIAFSKEDLVNMIAGDDEAEVVEKDLYVYCCSGDDVNNGDLTKVSDKLRLALDNSKAKRIILAVECNNVITNRIALLEEFTTSIGAKMIITRSRALEAIKDIVK